MIEKYKFSCYKLLKHETCVKKKTFLQVNVGIGVLVFDTNCFLATNVSIICGINSVIIFFSFEFFLNKFSCSFKLSSVLLNS